MGAKGVREITHGRRAVLQAGSIPRTAYKGSMVSI